MAAAAEVPLDDPLMQGSDPSYKQVHLSLSFSENVKSSSLKQTSLNISFPKWPLCASTYIRQIL